MDANELVERYVAIWNESDEAARRAGVVQLWADGGAHFTSQSESRGYDEIAARITRNFDRFVSAGDYRFRSLNNICAHHGTVKFNWAMMPSNGGMAELVGFDFFVLDEEGKIQSDYQFIEP